MGDISAAVRQYIENVIRLSQTDISASARSREWFIDRILTTINRHTEDGKEEPVLYTPKKIYFGSYFKGTKVQVVDEYDILLVIDTHGGVYKRDDIVIGRGQGIADPNPLFSGKYDKTDGSGVSPSKLLNWLKDVVEEVVDSFGGISPIRNGQAVTARIESRDIAIDLVPGVILTRVSDGKTFYAIPRGDVAGGWIATAPNDDKRRLARVAEGRQDFKNVVRILKRIRDTYNFKVTSFAIETDVVNYAETTSWTTNIGFEVRYALSHLACTFRSGIMADPFDPQSNLLQEVGSLGYYAERIDSIVTILDNCQEIDDQSRIRELIYKAFENE